VSAPAFASREQVNAIGAFLVHRGIPLADAGRVARDLLEIAGYVWPENAENAPADPTKEPNRGA